MDPDGSRYYSYGDRLSGGIHGHIPAFDSPA
jgi:hypothetical protein